jgi:hypothetical protein
MPLPSTCHPVLPVVSNAPILVLQALDNLFKNETVGLQTRDEFVQKRATLQDRCADHPCAACAATNRTPPSYINSTRYLWPMYAHYRCLTHAAPPASSCPLHQSLPSAPSPTQHHDASHHTHCHLHDAPAPR